MEERKEFLIDSEIRERLRMEKVIVPKSVHDRINETIAQLPDKKKSAKVWKKIVVAATVAFGIFIGFGIAMPSYAQELPIIGSIFKLLDKGMYSKYDKYASDINITKEYKGVKVTVTSIVYDGVDLNIAYKVDTQQPMKSDPHILDKDFKINGKITTFGSTGRGELSNNDKTYIGVETFHVSKDYVPKQVQEETLLGGYVSVPDTFTLEMNIKEFLGDLKGKWNFKMPVSNEKVNGRAKEIECNIDLSRMEKGTKINKILITPLNTALQYVTKAEPEEVKFLVKDNKGRVFSVKSGSGTGKDGIMYFQDLYKEVYEDTKSLTIIPYKRIKVPGDKEGTKENQYLSASLNMEGETNIKLGKYGELKIIKIEVLNGQTKIQYQCEYGVFANPLIRDAETKEVLSVNSQYVEENGSGVMTFDVPLGNKKYIVECEDLERNMEIFEDLKFTVKIAE